MDLDTMAARYHGQLLQCPEGMKWHLGRGLTEPTIKKRQLGWITQPLTADHPKGAAVIPYITALGSVIELRRRSGGKPKYLRLEHDFPLPIKQHLYNAVDAMPSPRRNLVVICEGEYDAMIASQVGYRAIGVPGVVNWRDAWGHLLAEADVRVCFDGDDAGTEGAHRLAAQLSRSRVKARVVRMPSGMDVTDTYLTHGAKGLRKVIGA